MPLSFSSGAALHISSPGMYITSAWKALALAAALLCISQASAEGEADPHLVHPILLSSGRKLRVQGAAIEVRDEREPVLSAAGEDSEPLLSRTVAVDENGKETTLLLQMAAEEMLDAESRRAGRKALAQADLAADLEGQVEAEAMSFAPGAWPPPEVTDIIDKSACPSIDKNNLPTKAASSGDDWKGGLQEAVLEAFAVDPNASPAAQARLFCQTSLLCMAGYAVGSGLIFRSDFW